jgi:3-oxoacyl-[acyl-carrier protein] reductase
METGLSGCRALVLGASRGLGYACAEALIAEGASVFVSSRDPRRLRTAAKALEAAGWAAGDVAHATDVTSIVTSAVTALSGLDILVTNAGGPPTGPFETMSDQDWQVGHDLTVMSAVRLIREALPYLRASGRGRIVNLTGYGVKEPIRDLVVSDASRAAVTVMAKTIASELGRQGITVNNIAPGPILTDRLREIHDARATEVGGNLSDQLALLAAEVPVGRIGEPSEVGKLCAFLCSVHAAYITGQTIVIDGGINRGI